MKQRILAWVLCLVMLFNNALPVFATETTEPHEHEEGTTVCETCNENPCTCEGTTEDPVHEKCDVCNLDECACCEKCNAYPCECVNPCEKCDSTECDGSCEENKTELPTCPGDDTCTIEGCPNHQPTDGEGTTDSDESKCECPDGVHIEGCPEYIAPKTCIDGCTLEAGHEGECVVIPTPDCECGAFKDENGNIDHNEGCLNKPCGYCGLSNNEHDISCHTHCGDGEHLITCSLFEGPECCKWTIENGELKHAEKCITNCTCTTAETCPIHPACDECGAKYENGKYTHTEECSHYMCPNCNGKKDENGVLTHTEKCSEYVCPLCNEKGKHAETCYKDKTCEICNITGEHLTVNCPECPACYEVDGAEHDFNKNCKFANAETATVYELVGGFYREIETPVDVDEYDNKIIYIHKSDIAQSINFRRVFKFNIPFTITFGANFNDIESEFALVTDRFGEAFSGTYTDAVVTVAANAPAETEFKLNASTVLDDTFAGILMDTEYEVTVRIIDSFLAGDPSDIPECTCGIDGELEAHENTCARVKHIEILISEKSAHELYLMWAELPADAKAFIKIYLSENDTEKYEELLNEFFIMPLCECGTESAELNDHDLECVRRKHCEIIAEELSADEIFAFWEILDEDVKTYIVYWLEWNNIEKYGKLDILIDGAEFKELDSLVGETYIMASGIIPEGVTLTTAPVAEEDYSEELYNYIADSSDVVLAFDITPVDAEGNPWQPYSGEDIEVTVDLGDYEPEENTALRVFHEHEGYLRDLGVYEPENGMLTFSMDGFSKIYVTTVVKDYDGDVVLDGVVYLDLSAGNIALTENLIEGYRYDGTQSAKLVRVQGYSSTAKIHIYQSGGNYETGYFDQNGDGVKEIILPDYEPVTYNGMNWGDYITDNNNVEDVIAAWNEADKGGRKGTNNKIWIWSHVSMDITIDNVWSTFQERHRNRVTGGLYYWVANPASMTVRLKGDNRFGNIFYQSSYAGQHEFIFTDAEGDGKAVNTLTVANLKNNASDNYYCSAIGGSDSQNINVYGIVFNGGIVYAGTTVNDNATAIGGGGDWNGGITINGGKVTAVASTAGTAIGGGMSTYTTSGEMAGDVTITGGEVYAYNFGPYTSPRYDEDGNVANYYAPATAIGSGSSHADTIGTADINISGGTIYAYSVGGTAIGGGSSTLSHGGKATINITGGDVTAISAPLSESVANGILHGKQSSYPAGTGIGGGIGALNGGDCTLTISGENTVVRTGSIGGGRTLTPGSYTNGYAEVVIRDNATVHGQVVMASGASKDCSLKIENATINNSKAFGGDHEYYYIRDNGGAAYIENGNVTVKNSTIIGGGTDGMLDNGTVNDLTDDIEGNHIKNGGAFYINGGSFNMTSGTIKDCVATENGGAIYVADNTTVTVGTEGDVDEGIRIENNQAANGGGLYVDDNSFLTVYNGMIVNNKAVGMPVVVDGVAKTAIGATCGVGGGIYVDNGSRFELAGEKMGIYHNEADFAANDAYAEGSQTTLTLPEVAGMNLEGAGKDFIATGWYADYCKPDIYYPVVVDPDGWLLGEENPGRYQSNSNKNVEVTVGTVDKPLILLNNPNAYYCMTVGTNLPKDGGLTITKKLTSPATEDESFLFHIKGVDEDTRGVNMTVFITVYKGGEQASLTIENLIAGRYTVTEDISWNWRYKQKLSENEAATKNVAVSGQAVLAEFTNEQIKFKWLDEEVWCRNIFNGTNDNTEGTVTKDPPADAGKKY